MEVDAEIDFQHRVWIAQRVGWFVIGILILTATLGFVWERLAKSSRGGWQRVANRIRAFRALATADQDTSRVFRPDVTGCAERRYFDSVQIEQITLEPSAVESAGEWLVYR